jgi:hypothetical protein
MKLAAPRFWNQKGLVIVATPPARAAVHSPERRLRQARCTATAEEEHAVSTVMAGPVQPNWCAIRPARKARRFPVAVYALGS